MPQTFEQWRAAVDAILIAKLGIGIDDMRDRNYYDAFEDEVSPADFVSEEFGDDPDEMMMAELFG